MCKIRTCNEIRNRLILKLYTLSFIDDLNIYQNKVIKYMRIYYSSIR